VKRALVAAVVAASFLPGAATAGPGKTPPNPKADRLAALAQSLRRIELDQVGFAARRTERLKLLEELVALGTEPAAQTAIEKARSDRYSDVCEAVLQLLARDLPESPSVLAHFRERLANREDPSRAVAREYIVRVAENRRDDDTLADLFEHGTLEDRFVALRALGRMASKRSLPLAMSLLQDRSWKPREGTPVNCATIARSVEKHEGTQAARLLLLLKHDERFRKEDAGAVREATRLWRNPELTSHIRVSGLADSDPDARAEMASFLGEAGVEAARAPLVLLAFREDESEKVRAAAAEAIGGLRTARGDLAGILAKLASDPEARVREGAVRGLARLRVRQSAQALVDLLAGPMAADARAALAAAERLPAETNWAAWLASPACPLPEGT